MIFDGAQRPQRISDPLLLGSPTSAAFAIVGVIVRVGPARSRSAGPERSRGDLRFFLLISAWPRFPFHLPPHRNVYRRCHRWSRGSPYPAGTAPDQLPRFGLRLSPPQNPIYTLTT